MKEQEFIALLNLFIDGEISAADAARLEAEVRGDPRRRAIYRQYCRMHRAGQVLAEEFRAAESGPAVRQVVASAEGSPRRRTPLLLGIGGLAAAAAVAVLLVLRPTARGPVSAGATMAVQATAASPSPAPEPARGGIVQRPLLAADALSLSARFSDRFANSAGHSLDWISDLNFTPVPARVAIDELRFNERPAQLRPDARVISVPRTPADAPAEMSAFRFAK